MFDLLIDGLIGEILSSGIDISKNTIKAMVEKRQHKSIYAEIYRLLIKVLNYITANRYKNNQDKIYCAAETLLKLFKDNDKDDVKNIKSCLESICSEVNEDTCMLFKEKLYEEICRKDNIELYNRILLWLLKQENRYSRLDIVHIKQELDKINRKLAEDEGFKKESAIIQDVQFRNNKKDDYIQNWKSRLFLHHDDKKPITLANAFIMPDCIIHSSLDCIGFLRKDTLDNIIK